jgi:peptidoglycan/xylan/chitin deacetylase (PgdA/CDA1 family)
MTKWVISLILILISWSVSFYYSYNFQLPITRPIIEEVPTKPEILKYDPDVEKNICTPGGQNFEKPVVTLTFDDGWKEIYENAIPILNQAGIKSTQFVSTAVLWKNNALMHYMTIENVLDMERSGHEIASHAVDHQRLTGMTEADIDRQINQSREELLKMGVRSVDIFGPPYGEYNDASVEITRRSKYIGVRNGVPGMNDRKTDKFLLYGYQLENWMVFDPYIKRLVDLTIGDKKWLILVFHQVAKPEYRFYTDPNDLIKLLNYLVINKIPVMTMRDVIKKCY